MLHNLSFFSYKTPVLQLGNNYLLQPKKFSSCTAKQVLIKDYESWKTVTINFLPMLSNSTTCIAIGRFQFYVDHNITNIKNVCSSCRLFILSKNLKCLYYSYPTLLIAFESCILVESNWIILVKKHNVLFFV